MINSNTRLPIGQTREDPAPTVASFHIENLGELTLPEPARRLPLLCFTAAQENKGTVRVLTAGWPGV